MAEKDTQASILVGAAALSQFLSTVKQHPAPAQLAVTGVNLAAVAVGQLSPTSKALPWLQLASAVLQQFFPPPPQVNQ